MGRRSDHSRTELREMIVAAGHRQMEQVGFARFSAREVAKTIGYSIGTIYNVFGSYDHLILAINARTLELWHDYLETRLDSVGSERLRGAIEAYFEFAVLHRHAWTAVFDFHWPDDQPVPDFYRERVEAISAIVAREVARELPDSAQDEVPDLARSLLATVHGHCSFALSGTFAMLGGASPLEAAYARVRDAVARLS